MGQVFGQEVMITAHRGASGHAPENTLSAVRKALETGVDRIEVDVQQTSDGVVVCMHDARLDRTTDRKGKVAKKTYAELKQVHAHGAFPKDFPNEPVPTLEQVFELMDGKTQLVIEIKAGHSTYPNIEDHVVDLIHRFKAGKWAVIHSFNDRVLHLVHQKYPDIRLQKLFVWYRGGFMLDFRLHRAKLSDYDFCEGFGISRTAADRKLIEQIHSLGKQVHVWTVNDPEEMRRLIEMGVDGIISNYPDRVKACLGP